MYKLIKKLITFTENQPLNFIGWVISFFTLLGLNLFFQFITYGFNNISFEYFIGEIIQPYYFILYLGVVIFLYLVTREKIKKISSFVLWGFWSIIFWPIIDKLILKEGFHLSFYIYDGVFGVFQKLITFFGPITPVGILYGTRIETIFIILLVGFYIYYKTGSFLRTFLGGLGVYVIFYVSVALPSILVFMVTIFSGDNVMEVTKLEVVKFFNTPFSYFGIKERGFEVTFFYKISLLYNFIFIGLLVWLQYLWDKKILNSLFKNIRLPQMIFNLGLLLGGILIGLYYIPNNLTTDIFSWLVLMNLLLSVLFVWLFSVVINDIEDYEIDKISNKNRPLVIKTISRKIYLNYGLIFLFLSLLLSITVSSIIFLIILLYSLLTAIYSKYPFKLKRIPWIAGGVSALASLLFFLIGYILITGDQMVESFPWVIVLFLFISYALVLPIKDLKDIKSDKDNDILTIANLLGEKKARVYFGVVIFLLYIFSSFIFLSENLFLLAVFFGSTSYWIVNNNKNKRNKLLYKLLGVATLYLLVGVML